ncbi:hypothetical protein HYY75_13380, partial [bacterium]|nr:hypothetical protein [bacterium]
MNDSQLREFENRQGSILIFALGILFCMILYSVAYLNYMMMQKRLSERAGKQGIMSRIAFALATLAVHKMQFGPLLAENSGAPFPEKNEDSPSFFELYRELSSPHKDMKKVGGIVNLEEVPTSDLFSITKDLLAPIEKMGHLNF